MKSILLASAVALALSSGAAFAATDGYLYPGPMPATGAPVTQQSANKNVGLYGTQTGSNPTGQTVYGPHGEVSLWDPNPNS